MLKILLPTTFPIAISYSPFLVAVTDVTNSGKLVPRAIIVKPIILSLTPIAFAKADAESTTKLLPIIIDISPTKVNIIALNNGITSLSFSSSTLLRINVIK